MTHSGLYATAVRKSINLLRRAAPVVAAAAAADPTVASEIPCRVTSTPWGMCVCKHGAPEPCIERDDDPCVCECGLWGMQMLLLGSIAAPHCAPYAYEG
jgi:hypothetical protein